MHALVCRGPEDIRYEEVPDPVLADRELGALVHTTRLHTSIGMRSPIDYDHRDRQALNDAPTGSASRVSTRVPARRSGGRTARCARSASCAG
jgi:hypothetical protein